MQCRFPWDVAILIGRDGAEMCIAANKLREFTLPSPTMSSPPPASERATTATCYALADLLGAGEANRIVGSFVAAQPANGRYARMVEKLRKIEVCAGVHAPRLS